MLKEVKNVRQFAGESKRRWFSNDYFDLIVWLDDGDEILGFQLCYDVTGDERALTWEKTRGFTHDCIDSGDDKPGIIKASPVLAPDGVFDHKGVGIRFRDESSDIDSNIADFVYTKIIGYPDQ